MRMPSGRVLCLGLTSALLIAVITAHVILLPQRVYAVLWTRSETAKIVNAFVSGQKQQRTVTRRPCSFNLLKQEAAFREDGYLNGSGVWFRNRKNEPIRFEPLVCSLRYGITIPVDRLQSCLRQNGVRFIAVVGDSNALRQYLALRRLVSGVGSGGGACSDIANRQIVNISSYGKENLMEHRCATCGGLCAMERHTTMSSGTGLWNSRCRFGLNHTLDLEFTRIDNTMEKIGNRRLGCQKADGSIVNTKANSRQQFMLSEFWSDPPPDLLLVFGNNHESSLALPRLADLIDEFSRIVDQYAAPSTTVVWLSRFGEYNIKKPAKYRTAEGERNRWLDAANRLVYRKLRDRFVGHGKPLLFPDLLAMSLPVLGDWSRDGVHMHQDWYSHVMSFFLQTFCRF